MIVSRWLFGTCFPFREILTRTASIDVVKMDADTANYVVYNEKAFLAFPKELFMTRMTRELSLVLVGASLLTGGYFLWPEQDFEKRAEEQAERRVGGRSSGGTHVVFISRYGGLSSASGVARAPSMAGVSRGGLGGTGGRVGGASS